MAHSRRRPKTLLGSVEKHLENKEFEKASELLSRFLLLLQMKDTSSFEIPEPIKQKEFADIKLYFMLYQIYLQYESGENKIAAKRVLTNLDDYLCRKYSAEKIIPDEMLSNALFSIAVYGNLFGLEKIDDHLNSAYLAAEGWKLTLEKAWQNWLIKFDNNIVTDDDTKHLYEVIRLFNVAFERFITELRKNRDLIGNETDFQEIVDGCKTMQERLIKEMKNPITIKDQTQSKKYKAGAERIFEVDFSSLVSQCFTLLEFPRNDELSSDVSSGIYRYFLVLCQMAGILVPRELRIDLYGDRAIAACRSAFFPLFGNSRGSGATCADEQDARRKRFMDRKADEKDFQAVTRSINLAITNVLKK